MHSSLETIERFAASRGCARTRTSSPLAEFSHQLPRAHVVDRVGYLLQLARNRRVIHLGFVDEGRMSSKRRHGTWLHDELSRVAAELLGIDLNSAGVELAKQLGF